MKDAMFWSEEDGKVRCSLCYQKCLIKPGKRGICGVRENRDGRLVSLVYGRPIAKAIDPVEKKPLYHFLPGSRAFSIGTVGCNFRCLHCQNCNISQVNRDMNFSMPAMVQPEQIVAMARREGCDSIAYTYTEPTIFFEYAYDIAKLAKEAGLKNLFITNGYMMPEAVSEIQPYLDAANIDLKFFDDDLYRKVAGARLQPILDSIRFHHQLGIWIEATTLVIPEYNDDEGQLRGIAEFLAGIDENIPWHISAFYPTYKLTDVGPTPRSALDKAAEIGHEAGLKHVYLGNVRGRSDTACPDCGETLIERRGMGVTAKRIEDGKCPECGTSIAGVWS